MHNEGWAYPEGKREVGWDRVTLKGYYRTGTCVTELMLKRAFGFAVDVSTKHRNPPWRSYSVLSNGAISPPNGLPVVVAIKHPYPWMLSYYNYNQYAMRKARRAQRSYWVKASGDGWVQRHPEELAGSGWVERCMQSYAKIYRRLLAIEDVLVVRHFDLVTNLSMVLCGLRERSKTDWVGGWELQTTPIGISPAGFVPEWYAEKRWMGEGRTAEENKGRRYRMDVVPESWREIIDTTEYGLWESLGMIGYGQGGYIGERGNGKSGV